MAPAAGHVEGGFQPGEAFEPPDSEVLGAAVYPRRLCVPAVIPTGQGRPQPPPEDEAGLSNSAGLQSAVGDVDGDAGLSGHEGGGPADLELELKEALGFADLELQARWPPRART